MGSYQWVGSGISTRSALVTIANLAAHHESADLVGERESAALRGLDRPHGEGDGMICRPVAPNVTATSTGSGS